MTERTLRPAETSVRVESVQDEVWRTLAGVASAILVCTLAVGAITFLGAGEHLPLRVRLDNVAGGALLMLLVAVPASLFGLWPADAATRALPRAARLAIFASGGALVGAIAGAAFASVWGTMLDGALVGAGIGLLGGVAGYAGLTRVSRSRPAVVVLVAITLATVAYGTWRLQSF